MLKKPFFSVIVPAHNSEGYIRKLLHSIVTQTYKHFELIVVCDNCDDGTGAVASRFTHRDNIYYTYHGLDGLARNEGLENANGDWVLFADDDDWFLHEYAFEMIADSITDDLDMLCFGFIWKHKGYASPIRNVDGMKIFYPAVWNKAYKRSFIADTRFKPIQNTLTVASDLDFTNQLLAKNPNYALLDQPLYYYNYLRKGSQTEVLHRDS